MKTKGKRLDGIIFTNADPRYAGKLNDPQGGDMTMLMQQVREVIRKKPIVTNLKNRFEHIELSAKLLDYFLRSNKSNINQ